MCRRYKKKASYKFASECAEKRGKLRNQYATHTLQPAYRDQYFKFGLQLEGLGLKTSSCVFTHH